MLCFYIDSILVYKWSFAEQTPGGAPAACWLDKSYFVDHNVLTKIWSSSDMIFKMNTHLYLVHIYFTNSSRRNDNHKK